MERLRQTHSKEIESKDEEVEEIRQSCSKKVRYVQQTTQASNNIYVLAIIHFEVIYLQLFVMLFDYIVYITNTV